MNSNYDVSIEANFDIYFDNLIKGNRRNCLEIVKELKTIDVSIEELYEHLFKRALYKVGDLWENNVISVAKEHMATAITEGIMNTIYADLDPRYESKGVVIVTTTTGEKHQVGAKMVADIFELFGWECYFLGAETPVSELIKLAKEVKPDIIAISLTVYTHLHDLYAMIREIKIEMLDVEFLIGGQAFNKGSSRIESDFTNLKLVSNIIDLEQFLVERSER